MLKLTDPSLLRSQLYIDGKWVDADNGATMGVFNPATKEEIVAIPNAGAAETRRAIEAADRAFNSWRQVVAKERSAILKRWFALIMANQEDLARLMTAEQGKPLAESRGEVAYGAAFVEWFAEEGRRIYGDTISANNPNQRIVTLKQPVGVVAAITPWNFPIAMITRKVAPALAAGCTVVLKPATETPLCALALAALGEKAGIPAGAFSVVAGNNARAIGGEMTGNTIVRKVTFTGSTEIGKVLMAQCAGTVKKTSMELGGNAPFIVFDDADLDAAVVGAMASKYRNAGQTCVCANRILVQESVFDAFAAKLVTAVQALRMGNGADEGVTVGPLINDAAFEKVSAIVNQATANGAKVLTGGKGSAASRDRTSTNPPYWSMSTTPWMSTTKRYSAPSRHCSNSRQRRKPSASATTRPLDSPPTFTRAISGVSGGSPRASTTASSASMRALSLPRWRHSAA